MKKENLDEYVPTELVIPEISIFTHNVVDIKEIREKREKESKNKAYLDILNNAINKIDW